LPANQDDSNASGLGQAQTGTTPATPPVQAPRPVAPPPGARAPSPPVASGPGLAPGSTPVPIESPAPRYPIDALRNGESGTVLLRVHVGADGVPVAVDLVKSSRSRSLDRAASEAVTRWRFRPAQRNGQAVPGEVQVPIAFNAAR
jgi:periplasmic protein TonB